MTSPDRAGALLTVDLDAIVANWRQLRAMLAAGADCAAVVKADAYGLGAIAVGPALYRAGCRRFFVATIDEGIALRAVLPRGEIFVLHGVLPGTAAELQENRLIPVLSTPDQVERWAKAAGAAPQPAALHVDTGMSRLGLAPGEIRALAVRPDTLGRFAPLLLISHLACAEQADHGMNHEQRQAFEAVRAALPPLPASLASSSGIFLGPPFHYQLARPGAALYGLTPQPGRPNPMAQVLRLEGKILQLGEIDSPATVGYGATHRVGRRSRIATVAVGYADGYPRALSNQGSGFVGDQRVPVVGRISMDLVTFDVTDAPADRVQPGATIELIGPHLPPDEVAIAAGTIGYEILTSLGRRYYRRHLGAAGE